MKETPICISTDFIFKSMIPKSNNLRASNDFQIWEYPA